MTNTQQDRKQDGILVTRINQTERALLEDLCISCSQFFELVHGTSGGAENAAEILEPASPAVSPGIKHVLGFRKGDSLVGVMELLQNYPQPFDWYVGLLLLRPEFRGRGLGAGLWGGVREWLMSQSANRVRLIVQEQNPRAKAFWEVQDFSFETELAVKTGVLESNCSRLRLDLR